MKRTLSLLLAILLLLTNIMILASCDVGGSGDGDGGSSGGGSNEGSGGDDTPTPPVLSEGQTYFDSESSVMVLTAGEAAARGAAEILKDKLNEEITCGGSGRTFIGSVYATESKHEITVGYVPEREISIKAYAELQNMEREYLIEQSGFLVYAEGGSIAIAYDTNPYNDIQPLDRAVEKLIGDYIADKDYLLLDSGVLFLGALDIVSIQSERDAKAISDSMARLKRQVSEDIYTALMGYYSLFTDLTVDYLATLYSSDIGGFYTTASSDGREYYDARATALALRLATECEMADKLLPVESVRRAIYCLKYMQGADGYFYNSLGGAPVSITQRMEDLISYTEILAALGASPTYDTPLGTEGDGVTAEEYWAQLVADGLASVEDKPCLGGTTGVTERLGSGISHGQAREEENTAYPAVSSHGELAELLGSLDMAADPVGVSRTLAAMLPLIKVQSEALGKYEGGGTDGDAPEYEGLTLEEMLVSYLDGTIGEMGMIGTDAADLNSAVATSYILDVYNRLGAPYGKPAEAAESLLSVLTSDEECDSIYDAYGVWAAMDKLLVNAEKYCDGQTGSTAIVKIKTTLDTMAAEAISKTYTVVKEYRNNDGGFSCGEAHIGAECDGCIEAVAIATVMMTDSMLAVLGADKVPVFTESDWLRLIGLSSPRI